jgi:uncharacterized protein YdeI (YjbR/CyaY-like superfamily)
MKTVDPRTAEKWRQWLAAHHDSATEVWLVFHKQHTGRDCLTYEDAVQEALCYGWVDSLIKRLDDDRYARKFTPRNADSRWSTLNRKRYAALKAAGRLAPAGLKRPPTARSGDAPAPRPVPTYVLTALAADPLARARFEALPPSHRRQYLAWIDSAKREETRRRRLEQAVQMLSAGKRLGLK